MTDKHWYLMAIDDWERVRDALYDLRRDMPKGEKRELIGCICHDGNGYWIHAKLNQKPPWRTHHALYVMWLMGKCILEELIQA